LKLAGFAVVGTALSGCERAPVKYAVPYLNAPDEIVPGRSYNYASTCGGCRAACGLLIKNRDGRPIKLEGNPDHPLSRGGLCAAGQASLLGFYDRQRLQEPQSAGQPATWAEVDREIGEKLESIRKQKGAVRFLTGPVVSPTKRSLLRQFLATFENARHVVFDPRSCSAILDAHARTHGVRVLPHYHFGNAVVLVGFEADFLGTWISPVEFTHAYQLGRKLEGAAPRLSYHVQFESSLSITGSKADRRVCVTPGQMAASLNHLAARLGEKTGVPFPRPTAATETLEKQTSAFLDSLADELWQNQQRSLILSGSQDVELQVLVNFLNHILGNYESTVDIVRPSNQAESDGEGLLKLVQELRDEKVAALFIDDCNPVHDLPEGGTIAESLKKVPLVVGLGPRLEETSELAHFVCPEHHYLEAWSDSEPTNGLVALTQPAIAPLAQTRSSLESLAAWSGKPRTAYDLLREHWEKEVFPRQAGRMTFQEFWDRTLHNGFGQVRPRPIQASSFNSNSVRPASRTKNPSPETFSLLLYTKAGMPDSSHAYNAWLHELPDPISKVVWDNYVCVAPATADRLGLRDGDVVRIEGTGTGSTAGAMELPAFVQPGQHESAVAVALGYGSQLSRRFANIGPEWLQARPTVGADGQVGKNAASMLSWVDGNLCFSRESVRLSKTGRQHSLASIQSYYQVTVPPHLALPGQQRRPIIRETTLARLSESREHGSAVSDRKTGEEKSGDPAPVENHDLWPADHAIAGPRWGMVIDLNACTGCSACVVACQAENNIPVVGKDEVKRQREMHWLRIDRYYTEREDGIDVAHQPMLCQHCGNAPCEVVCPVLATVHSDEGLNQQVYNRCVGTRYCANNCPYKVRRFNWFDYVHDDLLQNLVLNPDVTVRSRGVMEKCTFCVQRIQEAKQEAGEKTPRDGVIETACQQSCPAHAIVFGNLNDPTSRVSRLAADSRSYQVLGELNIRPSVSYLEIVRNRPAEGGEKRG
jgi:molybdopterin-containing oxidoreductase family iron-sulfur binding subunit